MHRNITLDGVRFNWIDVLEAKSYKGAPAR